MSSPVGRLAKSKILRRISWVALRAGRPKTVIHSLYEMGPGARGCPTISIAGDAACERPAPRGKNRARTCPVPGVKAPTRETRGPRHGRFAGRWTVFEARTNAAWPNSLGGISRGRIPGAPEPRKWLTFSRCRVVMVSHTVRSKAARNLDLINS